MWLTEDQNYPNFESAVGSLTTITKHMLGEKKYNLIKKSTLPAI